MLRRLILALILLALPLRADELPPLSGPVVLTITGLDEASFPGGRLELDMAMLKAMAATDITTSSIWTDGIHVYTGVLVRTLAEQIDAGNHALKFHALNDYSIIIPASETTEDAPLLAYEMDGQPMPVRDKGPLWVIYPYDGGAEYRTDTTFSRSIWQLDRIDVVP